MNSLKYLARIRGLTAEQRERLAGRLNRHSGEPSPQRLVAYLVPQPGTSVTEAEVREFLGRQLPEHMCPAGYVLLESLPLLPNGKVDRKALPRMAGTQTRQKIGLVEPRNEVEEKLAVIWTAVLGAEKVGVFDNFFQLGGHSLLALQVMARLREAFQTEVPLRRLFETPTIAGLAEAVEQSRKGLLNSPIRRIARPSNAPVLDSDRPPEGPVSRQSPSLALEGEKL